MLDPWVVFFTKVMKGAFCGNPCKIWVRGVAMMIEVKGLTKYFGPVLAVDDISFTVERGEVLGFLGPNGAGKSTTMRMITGFLAPSSGTALIGGKDIMDQGLEARKNIGYLPENAPVYPDMTVLGFLEFCAEVRGYSGKERKRRVEDTIERCFLKEVRHQSVGTLSKGFKQRVCFAQAILHDPPYLIMDEPTDGLDPNQKHEVRTMIRDMAAQKTMIISTHILEEVEAVCTRAIIIARGKIVADDTPENLKAMSKDHGALRLRLEQKEGVDFVTRLQELPWIKGVEALGPPREGQGIVDFKILADTLPPDAETALWRFCCDRGWAVVSLFREQGRLDQVFRMITTSLSSRQTETEEN